jgi:hypothetical protein
VSISFHISVPVPDSLPKLGKSLAKRHKSPPYIREKKIHFPKLSFKWVPHEISSPPDEPMLDSDQDDTEMLCCADAFGMVA